MKWKCTSMTWMCSLMLHCVFYGNDGVFDSNSSEEVECACDRPACPVTRFFQYRTVPRPRRLSVTACSWLTVMLTLWCPLLPCCHVGTAVKYHVPGRVQPSFVIFDIQESGAQGWASECPDVKDYKWRLNPVWHRMLYSCMHMETVGVKEIYVHTSICDIKVTSVD